MTCHDRSDLFLVVFASVAIAACGGSGGGGNDAAPHETEPGEPPKEGEGAGTQPRDDVGGQGGAIGADSGRQTEPEPAAIKVQIPSPTPPSLVKQPLFDAAQACEAQNTDHKSEISCKPQQVQIDKPEGEDFANGGFIVTYSDCPDLWTLLTAPVSVKGYPEFDVFHAEAWPTTFDFSVTGNAFTLFRKPQGCRVDLVGILPDVKERIPRKGLRPLDSLGADELTESRKNIPGWSVAYSAIADAAEAKHVSWEFREHVQETSRDLARWKQALEGVDVQEGDLEMLFGTKDFQIECILSESDPNWRLWARLPWPQVAASRCIIAASDVENPEWTLHHADISSNTEHEQLQARHESYWSFENRRHIDITIQRKPQDEAATYTLVVTGRSKDDGDKFLKVTVTLKAADAQILRAAFGAPEIVGVFDGGLQVSGFYDGVGRIVPPRKDEGGRLWFNTSYMGMDSLLVSVPYDLPSGVEVWSESRWGALRRVPAEVVALGRGDGCFTQQVVGYSYGSSAFRMVGKGVAWFGFAPFDASRNSDCAAVADELAKNQEPTSFEFHWDLQALGKQSLLVESVVPDDQPLVPNDSVSIETTGGSEHELTAIHIHNHKSYPITIYDVGVDLQCKDPDSAGEATEFDFYLREPDLSDPEPGVTLNAGQVLTFEAAQVRARLKQAHEADLEAAEARGSVGDVPEIWTCPLPLTLVKVRIREQAHVYRPYSRNLDDVLARVSLDVLSE